MEEFEIEEYLKTIGVNFTLNGGNEKSIIQIGMVEIPVWYITCPICHERLDVYITPVIKSIYRISLRGELRQQFHSSKKDGSSYIDHFNGFMWCKHRCLGKPIEVQISNIFPNPVTEEDKKDIQRIQNELYNHERSY